MSEFDYVIVGAGSAGCVLAGRLTEDADVSVLLLEAGGPDDGGPKMRMPLAYRRIVVDPKYNWSYQSEPEPHLDGRRIPIPRGRTLGGTSSINGMLYLRGHPRDYDLWRQAGNEGWSYAEVLPYFRRAEGSWRGETDYHGGDGPLGTTRVNIRPPELDRLHDSIVAAGLPLTDDFAGTAPEGFGLVDMTVKNGERASTARTYLRPALARPNLTAVTRALTRRIVVEQGRATGVEYVKDGRVETAQASREVILSAGAYNSPQILMLSGIGPADDIAAHGIAVVHDLPGVGANLSEHAVIQMAFDTKDATSFLDRVRLDRVVLGAAQWLLTRGGDMASQPLTGMAFLRTREGLERPDLQFFFNALRLDAEIWFPIFKPAQQHQLTSLASLMHPDSRGSVRLASADPADPPRILLNLLAAEEDRAALRRAMRLLREVYGTPPLADAIAREAAPGAEAQSDAELDAYLRQALGIGHHPVGTCAMGTGDDAVVDPQLRLRGIEGLRVVDASIMPQVPGGNTNAPTIMIGEKAADMIRGRAPLQPIDLKD